LLVLTGHKDQRFRAYVRGLSDRGLFRDKVVALFSCYEQGEEAFNSRLLAQKGGAKAILFFDVPLESTAATIILQGMDARLAGWRPADKLDLQQLLSETVEAALRDATLTGQIRNEIRQMRKGVVQVSARERPAPRGAHHDTAPGEVRS
jgi:hypothetical protein